MSAEFPTLADIANAHADVEIHGCGCSGITESTGEHIADMWRYACTITTVEQLDALRADPLGDEGAIVKDATGDVFEANDDGSWSEMGSNRRVIPEPPALLLWHPDWSAS